MSQPFRNSDFTKVLSAFESKAKRDVCATSAQVSTCCHLRNRYGQCPEISGRWTDHFPLHTAQLEASLVALARLASSRLLPVASNPLHWLPYPKQQKLRAKCWVNSSSDRACPCIFSKRSSPSWIASVVFWLDFQARDPEVPGSIPGTTRFCE
jgi:hypothetical protein